MEKNTAIENLTNKHTELVQAELNIKEAVYTALDAGMSWAQIGEVLGLSKQTTFARHSAGYKAHTATAQAPKFGMETPNISTASVQGRSVTASIFSDEKAPATAAERIHGARTVEVFTQFAADRARAKADQEDKERSEFWEAKRKYAVTVDGAIYSPRGENGWDLHKVLRNIDGRNFARSYNNMQDMIAANEGILYVSRDMYEGLVKNAASDRESWIMAATEPEHAVSARPELAEEIAAMAKKLDGIQAQLKRNRNKKGPDYKTGA